VGCAVIVRGMGERAGLVGSRAPVPERLANAVIVARRRAGSRYKIAVTKRQVTASGQWYSLGGGRVRGAGGRRPARSRLDRLVVAGSVGLGGRGWRVCAGLAWSSGHKYRGSGHCHRGWVWGGGGFGEGVGRGLGGDARGVLHCLMVGVGLSSGVFWCSARCV